MDATERFERLLAEPPSAKLVYTVLERDAPLTHGEIVEAAVLPSRTTSYALSRLQEAGVVEAVPCPSDPRKKDYRPLPIEHPVDAESGDHKERIVAESRQDPQSALPPEQPSD